MKQTKKQKTEREAIEALLPWYERGQLDAGDTTRVETYLAKHPRMASQLALVEEERAEAVLLNEERGAPGAGALDRLMNSIEDHEAANPSLASAKTALWGWASKLLGVPVPAKMQWIAGAAAVLIIVQGISLGVLMTPSSQFGGGYVTASGPGASVEGTFAFVQFTRDASASDLTQLLREFEFNIVDGPRPGGAYKIRIADETLDEAAREALLIQLQTRKNVIGFAAFVE